MVRRSAVLLTLFFVAMSPRPGHAHPIHTTMSELSCSPAGDVSIRVRTFADDFSRAVARHTRRPAATNVEVSDADAASYLRAAFDLRDAAGQPVAVSLRSQRRTGDVVWLELSAAGLHGLHSVQLLNRMLFDVHDDQVNIVQAVRGTDKHSVLFTHGDGLKKLW